MSKGKNGITILIVNRNNSSSLRSCFNSLRLVKSPKEIIVVDDASTDESAEVIKSLGADKSIYLEENGGLSHAREVGLVQAVNDLVIVLDSDIEITQFDSEEISKMFEESKDLVAISGKYASAFSSDWNAVLDERRAAFFGKTNQHIIYGIHDNYTTFSGGMSVLKMSRREKVRYAGERGAGGEDLWFQLSLLNKGRLFAYSPNFHAIHHHKRGFRLALIKARAEAKANVWLCISSLRQGVSFPCLDGVYFFPILLLSGYISLMLGKVELAVGLILLELLPLIVLLVVKPGVLRLRLIFYQFILYNIMCLYGIFYAIFPSGLRLSVRIKYLMFCAISSPYSKYLWIKKVYTNRTSVA